MRIVCLSDTHLIHRKGAIEVPDGDLLVHAGDATYRGKPKEIRQFNDWFAGLPHRHKIFVAGNHDFGFEREPDAARALLDSSITYLMDAEVVIEGLRIWGSPWQPWFHDWAFNLPRGPDIRAKWQLIPAGIDVLITHGPPLGIGDRTVFGDDVGCADLLDEIRSRIKPRLHVFGHIHEGYGRYQQDGVTYVNACTVDEQYQLRNPPVVVDL